MNLKVFHDGVPGQVALGQHADKDRDKEKDHVMQGCMEQQIVLTKS